MARPCKRRRVCAEPGCCRFGPRETQSSQPEICMTMDEYEVIRLRDLEGLNQEACARQMGVARSTVQAIYASARAKLAACLVYGRELHISGGEYELCRETQNGPGRCCGCKGRKHPENRENTGGQQK